MGEEEKKAEETVKMEEKKTEEPKKEGGGEQVKKEEAKTVAVSDEKKKEDGESAKAAAAAAAPPPPPPQEIILRVFMHCEGCARKVRRCLKGFPGVEEVETDCKSQKVVVKGAKADPVKVHERVQRKSHRKVELISPIPKPPAEEEAKKVEDKPISEPQDKKEEAQAIMVVLKVHMHCEACAQEIKKRIRRMKGVESAEADLKGSQVTVKGVFEAPKLVDYVYKRTGKHAVIVKQEPEKKDDDKGKDDKKGEEGGGEKDAKKDEKAADGSAGEGKEKKEGGGEEAPKPEAAVADGGGEQGETVMEMKKNEFYYYHPQNYRIYPPSFETEQMYSSSSNPHSYPAHAPPDQMFSDENPNACSVM